MSKTVGRKAILFNLPVDTYDKLKSMAVKKFNGNVTAMVIHLIEQQKNNL